jgi:hypothetical protein
MRDLIKRLEGATGPDRELDLAVCQVCGIFYSYADTPTGPKHISCPAYTASLDAALALVGEKLPDAAWSVGNRAFGGQAYLMLKPAAAMFDGIGSSPALAVLIALLKALEADQ